MPGCVSPSASEPLATATIHCLLAGGGCCCCCCCGQPCGQCSGHARAACNGCSQTSARHTIVACCSSGTHRPTTVNFHSPLKLSSHCFVFSVIVTNVVTSYLFICLLCSFSSFFRTFVCLYNKDSGLSLSLERRHFTCVLFVSLSLSCSFIQS